MITVVAIVCCCKYIHKACNILYIEQQILLLFSLYFYCFHKKKGFIPAIIEDFLMSLLYQKKKMGIGSEKYHLFLSRNTKQTTGLSVAVKSICKRSIYFEQSTINTTSSYSEVNKECLFYSKSLLMLLLALISSITFFL